jgi:Fe-S cluster biogenesis protein NfuA
VSGSGVVTSSPAGIDCGSACVMSFAQGTAVALTATPADGMAFSGWTGACTGSGACTVTMNADTAVTAQFSAQTSPPVTPPPVTSPPVTLHTLSVAVQGSGKVASAPAGIDCGTSCNATFAEGSSVTLTATPATGFAFSAFSGACSGATCTVTMSGDASVTATFAAIQPVDECAGLLPAALPAAVQAALPQNSCLDGTSDDGTGTFALGFTAGADQTFPEYLFFTIEAGTAVKVGNNVLGGDETGTFVYSQPSGFTVFSVFGLDSSSEIDNYDHGGSLQTRDGLAPAENFDHLPSSAAGIDPSGGTATVTHSFDAATGWTTSYKRFDKTGAPETGDVIIDNQDRRVDAVGVALSGHALVLVVQSPGLWQARWLARDGTALTDWFALQGPVAPGPTHPVIRFLLDGSVVVGFNPGTQGVSYANLDYRYRVLDGQTAPSALPDWLQARTNDVFYAVRGGRGYAAWGSGGACQAGSVEVLATSGKSCGCLAVPSLSGNSSVGRDGSLIVGEPPHNLGTCVWDLYPQLLK